MQKINFDPKVDAYIAKAQPFAKPILDHFREIVHRICPEVEEKMKWSFPHFDYKEQMMCSIAAFKQHCSITFWKAQVMNDPHGLLIEERGQGMGHLGKISSLEELPSDIILREYIIDAMRLNDEGVTFNRNKPVEKKDIATPEYLIEAMKKNLKALETFENFSSSNKREYIEWLSDAKTEETRIKRTMDAVEWMAEGKIRNWKYLKK